MQDLGKHHDKDVFFTGTSGHFNPLSSSQQPQPRVTEIARFIAPFCKVNQVDRGRDNGRRSYTPVGYPKDLSRYGSVLRKTLLQLALPHHGRPRRIPFHTARTKLPDARCKLRQYGWSIVD